MKKTIDVKLNWFGWLCLLAGFCALLGFATFSTAYLVKEGVEYYQEYKTEQAIEQTTKNMVDVICTVSGVPTGN